MAELDEQGRIVSFQEKPEQPRGRYRIPPFYLYTAEALRMMEGYLDQGGDPDAPGSLLAWLVGRLEVYALERPAGTYELGTITGYERTRRQLRREGPAGGSA